METTGESKKKYRKIKKERTSHEMENQTNTWKIGDSGQRKRQILECDSVMIKDVLKMRFHLRQGK